MEETDIKIETTRHGSKFGKLAQKVAKRLGKGGHQSPSKHPPTSDSEEQHPVSIERRPVSVASYSEGNESQGSATNSPAFSGGGTSSPLAPLSPLAAEGGRVLLTTGLPEATPTSSGVGSGGTGGRSSPRESLEEMRARLSHLKEAIQAQTMGQPGTVTADALQYSPMAASAAAQRRQPQPQFQPEAEAGYPQLHTGPAGRPWQVGTGGSGLGVNSTHERPLQDQELRGGLSGEGGREAAAGELDAGADSSRVEPCPFDDLSPAAFGSSFQAGSWEAARAAGPAAAATSPGALAGAAGEGAQNLWDEGDGRPGGDGSSRATLPAGPFATQQEASVFRPATQTYVGGADLPVMVDRGEESRNLMPSEVAQDALRAGQPAGGAGRGGQPEASYPAEGKGTAGEAAGRLPPLTTATEEPPASDPSPSAAARNAPLLPTGPFAGEQEASVFGGGAAGAHLRPLAMDQEVEGGMVDVDELREVAKGGGESQRVGEEVGRKGHTLSSPSPGESDSSHLKGGAAAGESGSAVAASGGRGSGDGAGQAEAIGGAHQDGMRGGAGGARGAVHPRPPCDEAHEEMPAKRQHMAATAPLGATSPALSGEGGREWPRNDAAMLLAQGASAARGSHGRGGGCGAKQAQLGEGGEAVHALDTHVTPEEAGELWEGAAESRGGYEQQEPRLVMHPLQLKGQGQLSKGGEEAAGKPQKPSAGASAGRAQHPSLEEAVRGGPAVGASLMAEQEALGDEPLPPPAAEGMAEDWSRAAGSLPHPGHPDGRSGPPTELASTGGTGGAPQEEGHGSAGGAPTAEMEHSTAGRTERAADGAEGSAGRGRVERVAGAPATSDPTVHAAHIPLVGAGAVAGVAAGVGTAQAGKHTGEEQGRWGEGGQPAELQGQAAGSTIGGVPTLRPGAGGGKGAAASGEAEGVGEGPAATQSTGAKLVGGAALGAGQEGVAGMAGVAGRGAVQGQEVGAEVEAGDGVRELSLPGGLAASVGVGEGSQEGEEKKDDSTQTQLEQLVHEFEHYVREEPREGAFTATKEQEGRGEEGDTGPTGGGGGRDGSATKSGSARGAQGLRDSPSQGGLREPPPSPAPGQVEPGRKESGPPRGPAQRPTPAPLHWASARPLRAAVLAVVLGSLLLAAWYIGAVLWQVAPALLLSCLLGLGVVLVGSMLTNGSPAAPAALPESELEGLERPQGRGSKAGPARPARHWVEERDPAEGAGTGSGGLLEEEHDTVSGVYEQAMQEGVSEEEAGGGGSSATVGQRAGRAAAGAVAMAAGIAGAAAQAVGDAMVASDPPEGNLPVMDILATPHVPSDDDAPHKPQHAQQDTPNPLGSTLGTGGSPPREMVESKEGKGGGEEKGALPEGLLQALDPGREMVGEVIQETPSGGSLQDMQRGKGGEGTSAGEYSMDLRGMPCTLPEVEAGEAQLRAAAGGEDVWEEGPYIAPSLRGLAPPLPTPVPVSEEAAQRAQQRLHSDSSSSSASSGDEVEEEGEAVLGEAAAGSNAGVGGQGGVLEEGTAGGGPSGYETDSDVPGPTLDQKTEGGVLAQPPAAGVQGGARMRMNVGDGSGGEGGSMEGEAGRAAQRLAARGPPHIPAGTEVGHGGMVGASAPAVLGGDAEMEDEGEEGASGEQGWREERLAFRATRGVSHAAVAAKEAVRSAATKLTGGAPEKRAERDPEGTLAQVEESIREMEAERAEEVAFRRAAEELGE